MCIITCLYNNLYNICVKPEKNVFTSTCLSNNLYSICITPEKNVVIVTRNAENIPLFNIRQNFFKNCLLTLKIIEGINLGSNLWNWENTGIFENNILKSIRPKPSNFLNCCNLRGIILIAWLCLEFSHLREHKLKYNFQIC